MRISILKESLCIGGMERSAANFSQALSKKHDVTLSLFYGDIMAYPYGGNLYDMNLPTRGDKFGKIINNVKRMWLYKNHIKEFNPDVAFQLLAAISPVGYLKLKDCVKVISARDFSSVQNNIKRYKRKLNVSDAMICNSEYLRDYFIEKYPEDKEKVFTVYNIIDIDFIREQAKEKNDNEFLRFKEKHPELIVSVGRFCKEKEFENLISAFFEIHKERPETGLVLVGDGELRESYLKKIEELNIEDSVYFTGYQKNPYKFMWECKMFVLSSSSEGFPNVLAEAMALSKPVVAVNCFSGPAEILMKNYDYTVAKENFVECDYGILTPHYNVCDTEFAIEKLSQAIIYLLSNEDLMKKYGDLSAERVACFSPTAAVENLEKIFETLVSKRILK